MPVVTAARPVTPLSAGSTRAASVPVPLAELEDELLGLAGHIAAAQSRFLALLAEFDRRDGWAGPGLRSCAHWLSWRAGMSLRTATEHVRVAHALTGLPMVAEAFAAGRLSYSKVRAITRIAVPTDPDVRPAAVPPARSAEREEGAAEREDGAAEPGGTAPAAADRGDGKQGDGEHAAGDADLPAAADPCDRRGDAASAASFGPDAPTSEKVLLDLALAGTASHVERVVRAARRLAVDPEAQTARRSVSWRWAEDGTLVLRARLDPAAGAAVIAALETAAAPAGPVRSHDDPPPPPDLPHRGAEQAPGAAGDGAAARRADAFVDLVTRADGPGPHVTRGGAEVVVHVDAADGRAALAGNGPELPPATAERLACDAHARVLLSDRRTNRLYLGRRRRLATPAQIAALTIRDGARCAFPGCTHQRHLHAHHVVSWLRGGPTDIDNLVLLCSFHHRLVHDRGYGISAPGPSGRHVFTRPDGTPVPPAGAPLSGSARDLVEAQARSGLRIGRGTLTPTWGGERLDPTPILHALLPALRPEATRAA